MYMTWIAMIQIVLAGLTKISTWWGEVDFPSGQEFYILSYPMGQGPGGVIRQLNNKKSQLRLAQDKLNLRLLLVQRASWHPSFFKPCS